jgi:DNA topoisomerase-1
VPGAAKAVIAQVAARLRNTVAVCRKSYIHPKVLELGALLADDDARSALLDQRWAKAAAATRGRALSAAERRLLAWLGPSTPRRAARSKRLSLAAADGSGICSTAAPAAAASPGSLAKVGAVRSRAAASPLHR